MQALAEMADRNAALHSEIIDLLRFYTRNGTPAMRARGRKLLAQRERSKCLQQSIELVVEKFDGK